MWKAAAVFVMVAVMAAGWKWLGAEDTGNTDTPENIDPFAGQMVSIPGGSFEMGDLFEEGNSNEKPIRTVMLSGFMLGKYEVTQAQWSAVMGNNPSHFKGCDQCPVERVSWEDVQAFLWKLNAMTGKKYRLPTEAEWEYAAREGGKKVRFGNGKDIADPKEINFNGSAEWKKPYSVVGVYREKPMPVGSFRPNALGLYDMSGNVWEWCSDWKGAYPSLSQTNPEGLASGSARVNRGGSWSGSSWSTRTTFRNGNNPTDRNNSLGFRVAL